MNETMIAVKVGSTRSSLRSYAIKHLMLNTYGVRIANEAGFAKRLAEYMPGFEVYLQFDSFEEQALRELRGADLRDVRARALELHATSQEFLEASWAVAAGGADAAAPLDLGASSYRALAEVRATYSWPAIARQIVGEYARVLREYRGPDRAWAFDDAVEPCRFRTAPHLL